MDWMQDKELMSTIGIAGGLIAFFASFAIGRYLRNRSKK